MVIVATTLGDLESARSAGSVLVPTMGAMHAGHLSLIERAREVAGADGTVSLSIFVNPTQFNETADFARYPRTIADDLSACEARGVDVVFVPEDDVMYPPGEDVPVGDLPDVATCPGLEDAHRPGHFEGVCQVVRRLFGLVRPRAAVFGEKDWQQYQVIREMTRSEALGVEIVGAPTVREPSGLALSSRNLLLRPEEVHLALALRRALEVSGRHAEPAAAEAAMAEALRHPRVEPEYAAVRDAETLMSWRPGRPARALVAARVGAVRLLDNVAWSPATAEHD